MGYTQPPATSPSITAEITKMINVFAANVIPISEKQMSTGLASGGIREPKISLPSLIQLTNNIILPAIHYWEGTWADHPTDTTGATMKGITLKAMTGLFNGIFINTDIPAVKAIATAWNTKHPKWRDEPLAKELLYAIGSNDAVAGLYFFAYMTHPSTRVPVAIMTEDPFLGYFYAGLCWGTGSNVYTDQYVNIDSLAVGYGWNKEASHWMSTINALGDKTVELATKSILARYNHIMKISRPEMKSAEFREQWVNRLLNDNKSDLMLMITINEKFNLNSAGEYQFTPAELEHLNRKAELYKKVTLEIPG